MTFTLWLKKQKYRDDPVGDLANDFIADKERIRYGKKFTKDYLISIHACKDALTAFDEAMKEYQKLCTHIIKVFKVE